MKIILRLLFLSTCFTLILSCSKDDPKNPVVGNWKLLTWTVDIPFNLDNNEVSSLNFLDKTACSVNETLTFDKNGIATSHDTFNPEDTIRLKDGTSDVYFIEEICAEGSIGFSTEYTKVSEQHIELNGVVGVLQDERLTFVYVNAIKIYNEALTEVIQSKDLTLVYTKK